ncbi:MAG: hypothetical protein JXA03_13415 [Bacteroidales bacterium]|nr:hypothetical protein [Bacteroidales bacterium]
MNFEDILTAFVTLGNELTDPANCRTLHGKENLEELIAESSAYNPWFTPSNVALALESIGTSLKEEKLKKWTSAYLPMLQQHGAARNIGVVLAGNIPAVGFHDMISVLITGNRFTGKLSSKDDKLLPWMADLLCSIDPRFRNLLEFTGSRLVNMDAVIATGSDNSARYFRYYFSKYPHIIRKNRNSIAILTGKETGDELAMLGKDVFTYFGLGCRNVSAILMPAGFKPEKLLQCWEGFSHLKEHNKYMNNYEYYKAVFLINGEEHLDSGFVILKRESAIASPVAVVYYDFYEDESHLKSTIDSRRDEIQCVVADPQFFPRAVPFGRSQRPELWDYADGTDTVEFLLNAFPRQAGQ